MEISQLTPEQRAPGYLAEYIGNELLHLTIALIVLLSAFFISYTISQLLLGRGRSVDVYLIMPLAYTFCIGNCVTAILLVCLGGGGRHVAYHLLHDSSKIVSYYKILVPSQIFYGTSITLPKIAILYMYLNIFVSKWSRRVTYLTGVIIVFNLLVMFFGTFLMCKPFAFNWDKTIPNGRCADMKAGYKYVSIPNILSDIMILALPISTLLKLQVSLAKKVAIFLTFAIGSLGIVTGILRAVYYLRTDFIQDRTYLGMHNGVWTVVEPSCYFICACMPGMRPLAQLVYERSHLRIVLGKRKPQSSNNTSERLVRSSYSDKSMIMRSDVTEIQYNSKKIAA